jgi:hypothetical protein
MSAARAYVAEALDAALSDAGLPATAAAVDLLVEALADSLEVLAGESAVVEQAWATSVPLSGGGCAYLGHWWSGRTLEGLALMLRRRS